jgi:hypothetical protein
VGFEPTISELERPKTVRALDRAATAIEESNRARYLVRLRVNLLPTKPKLSHRKAILGALWCNYFGTPPPYNRGSRFTVAQRQVRQQSDNCLGVWERGLPLSVLHVPSIAFSNDATTLKGHQNPGMGS